MFKAVVQWACNNSRAKKGLGPDAVIPGDKIRVKLGEALYAIRFPIMSSQQVTNEVSGKNILTHEKIVILFVHLCYGILEQRPDLAPFFDVPKTSLITSGN